MKTKIQSIFLLSIAFTLYLSACAGETGNPSTPPLNMANPASVYCENEGYQLEMRENENGTTGVCIFPDGTECEEWAFYRGECSPGTTNGSDQESFLPFSMKVVAIYGSVISSGTELPASSKLIVLPKGLGSIYLTGETGDIENQILAMQDKPMPSNKANFWGQLDCPSTEDCLLTVSHLRLDGPGEFPTADLVEGWEGVLYAGPPEPHSGGDDYFALLGQMPFQYGIDGADGQIRQQLESFRDTGQAVKIWGQVFSGRMDWNASQIIVSRIEVISADPSQIPPAPEW